jgi:heterotetrameric sarcosine oxidase delta subunit
LRIPCPFCGPRDVGEFVYRGDASPRRPAVADDDAFFDYVYMRTNPVGSLLEHWYHAQGCRSWLVVERDTVSHEIGAAVLAKGEAG